MQLATERRLREELGITLDLELVYQFQYQASFGEDGSENELCSVYLGRCNRVVQPNATEIEAIRFLSAEELGAEMDMHADRFTPWFTQEWETLGQAYGKVLGRYIDA